MTHPDKPHSPEERAELLSAYLDGALSAAESAEVKDLIENNAAFKADYERLLKLKHLTHRVNGDLETSDDSLWQNIAAELKSDQQQAKKNTPAEIDVEFISAYYDGEIARDDSACVAFESRLYHCAESNRILGDIDVVSEAVRRFGHRLEESCTLDICGEVMATYHAELSQVAEADRPEPVMEEIADIEETKEWQTIAKNIQRVSQELEQQAPDVWPEIAKQLSTGHNVLPLKKPAAKKNAPIKIWGSVAAAVLLLVMISPNLQQAVQQQEGALKSTDMLSQVPASEMTLQEMQAAPETVGGRGTDASSLTLREEANAEPESPESAESKINFEAKRKKESLALADSADEREVAPKRRDKNEADRVSKDDYAGYELASLPNKPTYNASGIVRTGGSAGMPAEGRFRQQRAMPASASAPVLQRTGLNKARGNASNEEAASYDSAAFAPPVNAPAPKSAGASSSGIPSSEEFLMNSLQEEMSNDEIELILGL